MVANFQPTNTAEWIRQRNKDIALLQRRGTQSDLLNSGSVAYGTLDAAYRGEGPALVTFEGYPTISTNTFEWMVPYRPTGSRTVLLMRVGGTWVITGQTTPNRIALDQLLTSNWIAYNERNNVTDWRRPEVDLLPSGIVVLGGLINSRVAAADNELIFTLPPGYRPDAPYEWLFGVNQSDNSRSIKIQSDGSVRVAGAGWTNGFVSFDGIAFPAAGVANWVNIGSVSGMGIVSPWAAYNSGTYGPPRLWLDPYGIVWAAGMFTGGSFTDGTNIFALPEEYRPYAQHHMQTSTNGGYGMVGHNGTPYDRVQMKGGAGGTTWISLFGATWVTTAGRANNPWHDVQFYSNTWARNGSFTVPSTLCREDGLRMANGFIASGTLGAYAFIVPPEMALPVGRANLIQTGANSVRGRIEVKTELLYPAQGSNLWFSLDSKVWMSGG